MNRNRDPYDPFLPPVGRERYCSRRAEFDEEVGSSDRRRGQRLLVGFMVLAAVVWILVFFYSTSQGGFP